ncbi:MAG: alanine racemase [Bdellovibrionales bacterium]
MTPRALINLDALLENYRFLQRRAAPASVGAAVKANAYGLGMIPIARALRQAGCQTFFTASVEEALTLREAIQDATIIALHGIDPVHEEEALAAQITPMINSLPALKAWTALARKKEMRLEAMIHLDTGMNRLGLSPQEQDHLADHPELLESLAIKAWVSHFACADDVTSPMTPQQLEKMKAILRRLPPAPVSLCNSSGIFWGTDYLFDLVRPGLALYGGNPTPHLPNPMRPVLELRAPIVQVRPVDAVMTVGYGASYTVPRQGRIATLAMGYADGYHRALSNKGSVMIGQHLAPIVGRISMDLITIDVTAVPEAATPIGAEATLIGPHRTIDAIAAEAHTIAYEIMTSLGPRVAREYQ